MPTKEALEFDEVRLDIFIVGGKTFQAVGIHGLFANPQERLLLHVLVERHMLHVTPKYLSKCVKYESGRVPLDHIHEMTVSIIRQQLRYSNKSIKEISADLDFPNLSFFGKFVKEHLGMSPTEYRQRNLREG